MAGSPSKKASNMTPSIPISSPSGSSVFAANRNSDVSPTERFAASQISIPAGAATTAALPSTKIVRSNTDRISIRPICGLRNGGNSIVNALGMPRSTVEESTFVAVKVNSREIPKIPVNIKADKTVFCSPAKSMETIAASIGNRPLQGVRQLVKTESSRSLDESMILQPTTPAALHPRPIQQVSACFPHASQA